MRVIVYLEEAGDMSYAKTVLEEAVENAELGSCGFTFHSGRSAFYERRKSGTVVIHVQQPKEESA